MTAPVEKIARRVVAAAVAVEPVNPLSWAIARDDEGRPLYLLAVVMGAANIERFDKALEDLRPHMKPVADAWLETPQ